jgi:hypothetical protein
MPGTDRKALLNVHGRQFYQMLHAGIFCSDGCYLVSHRDLRTTVDQEKRIDAFERPPQRCTVCQIADKDFDPVAVARSCPVCIAHEHSRHIVSNMVEALSHGAVLRRQATLSLAEAKEEVVKAVLAYLRA